MSLRKQIQGKDINNTVNQMLHELCTDDIYNCEVPLTCSKLGIPRSLRHLVHVQQPRHRELGATCY